MLRRVDIESGTVVKEPSKGKSARAASVHRKALHDNRDDGAPKEIIDDPACDEGTALAIYNRQVHKLVIEAQDDATALGARLSQLLRDVLEVQVVAEAYANMGELPAAVLLKPGVNPDGGGSPCCQEWLP